MNNIDLARFDKENKEHEFSIEKERKLTALYLLLTVVAIGLMTFVWHNKMGSQVLSLFIGLIVGVLLARMNYNKY